MTEDFLWNILKPPNSNQFWNWDKRIIATSSGSIYQVWGGGGITGAFLLFFFCCFIVKNLYDIKNILGFGGGGREGGVMGHDPPSRLIRPCTTISPCHHSK